MRYLVLGSILLFVILYLSRDMRDIRFASLLPAPLREWLPEGADSSPRPVAYEPVEDVKETRGVVEEKTALDQWIQSRLTQKGLKEMTESGHSLLHQASVL